MKDLIERADALAVIALGDTVNQLQAKIRAIPRALAPASGAAALAALRAERDALETAREMLGGFWAESIADRDRLAAANAALEAQVARLVGAVKEYHLALDRRQNGNTAGYRLQDEIQRILDMPWRQGAALAEVQADAPTEYERKVAQMKEDFPNGI